MTKPVRYKGELVGAEMAALEVRAFKATVLLVCIAGAGCVAILAAVIGAL